MLKRPNLAKPQIGFNQFWKDRDAPSLDKLPLGDFRQYLWRKLPSSAYRDAMLEPLRTPAQRKKIMDRKNKHQKREYIEDLTQFNPSGAEALDAKHKKKYRINTELLKHIQKKQRDENERK